MAFTPNCQHAKGLGVLLFGPLNPTLFCLRPRVRRVIGFGEVLKVQPCVDLGGADVGVAQQLLHAAQVAAGLQHMAGKGMAQHVRVHRRGHARLQAAPLQALPNRLRR